MQGPCGGTFEMMQGRCCGWVRQRFDDNRPCATTAAKMASSVPEVCRAVSVLANMIAVQSAYILILAGHASRDSQSHFSRQGKLLLTDTLMCTAAVWNLYLEHVSHLLIREHHRKARFARTKARKNQSIPATAQQARHCH